MTWTLFYILFLGMATCQNGTENSLPTTMFASEDSSPAEIITNVQDTTSLLKRIRANYARINAVKKWTAIKTGETLQSSEGGEAKFYYTGKKLEKITVRNYGEMGKSTTEFYLWNGKPSFVFEKTERYNSPYYLIKKTEGMEDIDLFDPTKSVFVEERSYFNEGILFRLLSNELDQLPVTAAFLKEKQKSLNEEFKSLMSIEKF